MEPTSGKIEEKSIFSSYCKIKGSIIVRGCFISTARENTAFSPVFPLADFIAETFYWLFHSNFKEKGISHFL